MREVPKLIYAFHEPSEEEPPKTYVPHHFYIGFGQFSTAEANQFFLTVYAWCESQFGPRSYDTWLSAGLSFYLMDDALAFEFKMRWM